MSLADSHYDKHYCDHHLGVAPYRHGEPHWENFFGTVATTIVNELAPRRVLDVGCSIGFLVAALRRLGVEAWGLDVSEYAISQVPDEIRPYCRVGRATDEIEGRYDLITCIEVLEHMPPEEAGPAIANIARHADSVLFSSTPKDFEEPSHHNVRAAEYWVELFAREGLFRDLDVDASFLAPQAIYFSRRSATAVRVAVAYERWHGRVQEELRELRNARSAYFDGKVRLNHLEEANVRVHEELARLQAELADARTELLRTISDRDSAREQAEQARRELQALQRTRTMRYTSRLRSAYARVRQRA